METQQVQQTEDKPKTTAGAGFNFGSILGSSFNTLKKKPVMFCGLALIATVPTQLAQVLFTPTAETGTFGILLGSLIPTLLAITLGMVIQGAIAYGVFQVLRGQNVGIGNALSRGMAHLVPLVVVSLLAGIGTTIGMALFIIPGIILWCMWAVAIPACVVEKLPATTSLSRSAELTKGYRGKIFGLVIIATIISVIFGAIFGGIFGSILPMFLLIPVLGIVLAIPQAYIAILMSTIYYELRSVKEGVSLDALAKVFD